MTIPINERQYQRMEILHKEVDNMLLRYPYECSAPITRKATAEEMKRDARRTSCRDYTTFLKNAIKQF